MNKLLTRLILIACAAALPFAATAGVTGTHGPDRGSGGVVAKPKPAPTDEQTEQTAKPEEKKEVEVVKEPNK